MFDAIPNSTQILARGCILSETLTESAHLARETHQKDAEKKASLEAAAKAAAEQQQRVNDLVQQRVTEAVTKEINTIQAAEQQRRQALETAWDETVRTLKNEIQKQILDMSVQIAEIIIQRELPDREMLRTLLEETLAPVSDLQGVRVRMAPTDCPKSDNNTDQIGAQWRSIEWIEDPALAPGDVIVESRNGIFDARIKERLARLREAIASPTRYALPKNVAISGTVQ